MDVEVVEQLLRLHPASTEARVHDLQPPAQAAPHDDEVRRAVGVAPDEEGRERVGLREEKVIERQHDLLGVEPELHRHFLDDVDRRAVDVGLTSFSQAPVADRDAEAFEQALHGRRAAVHRRGLDDLRREEAVRLRHATAPPCASPAAAPGSGAGSVCVFARSWAADRSTSWNGDARSTSISTLAGIPCWSGTSAECFRIVSSTRAWLSRTSLATSVTRACTSPNSVHGKPSRRTRASCPSFTRPSAVAGGSCATTRRLPEATIVAMRSPSLRTEPSRTLPISPSLPVAGARMLLRSMSCWIVSMFARSAARSASSLETSRWRPEIRVRRSSLLVCELVLELGQLGAERGELGVLLIGERTRAHGLHLGDGTALAQRLEPVGLVGLHLRGDLGLLHPGPRHVDRRVALLRQVAERALLGGEGVARRLELGGDPFRSRVRLGEL